jgi:quinol monooxygenase YgiN
LRGAGARDHDCWLPPTGNRAAHPRHFPPLKTHPFVRLDGVRGYDGAVMSGVRLVIQFTADSAEIADKAIGESVERCKKAQQEPGCLQFEVFRSALRPESYVLLEHWASKAALAEHAKGMANNPPRPNPGIKRVREDYEYQAT